mgnify:CR=1 FL=1
MKRLINLAVRSSICNLRCTYCYLNQKDVWFKNQQISYSASPEIVARAFSKNRLGGLCLFNVCADGETLLAKDIVSYLDAILSDGHYIELVTNMTISSVIDKILLFDAEKLERIEFKCSFHYLQLKSKGLLGVFADNVKKVRKSGCSICIEMIPDDSLVPLIDEIKTFSIENFGALPQLSIPRNDNEKHDLLSSHSLEDFTKIWSSFESQFFNFKLMIINKKIKTFCAAGRLSLYVDLATGYSQQCYKYNGYSFNIYENLDKSIPFCSICKCNDNYCYNGHALLSIGCTRDYEEVHYGEIRNRKTLGGEDWLSSDMLHFMNEKAAYNEAERYKKSDKKTMEKAKAEYLVRRIKNRLKK